MTTAQMANQKISPMMAQWHSCKKNAPDSLLFFRLGDFYEAFYEDAVVLSKELNLTLTKRQDIPMAGVPFHSSENYIDKLISKGYRVAIAEQLENPRDVKGLVKREIVRIVTPGTLVDSLLLSDKKNNFLAGIVQVGELHGLSVLDLTTADFKVMEFENSKMLVDELCRLDPREILVSEKWQKKHPELLEEFKSQLQAVILSKEDRFFDHHYACDVLLRHFRVHTLDAFGLSGMVAGINAAGALIHYIKEDLNLKTEHIKKISKETLCSYMQLDRSTQKNLELFESLKESKKSSSLLNVIDFTETPMGGRLIKQWLSHPLLDLKEIEKRQEGVEAFLKNSRSTSALLEHLSQIRDLERLMMRIETGYATPRDLAGLRFSLEHVLPLSSLLEPFLNVEILAKAREKITDVNCLYSLLQKALSDSPPLRLSEGGIFRSGFHSELDQLSLLQSQSHLWIANYQTQLREQTLIRTLKVGYTHAFGYFIEVSRVQAEKIPSSFERKQTLVNGERFITPELKEFEYKMLHAEGKISQLENELFHALRKEVASAASQVRTIAEAVATADCLLSFARAAQKYCYVRPRVDNSDVFHVSQGRHPVIESTLSSEMYVPNDVCLCQDRRLYLITGPNMAGKSTFIRQVALIAILAQMGSFVPAKEAHIGIIDKVFSRIGASDDLSKGQSTFMVEMTETANILHNATDRSLVILDEIGRGTSTKDGISIAWSVAEYLLTKPQKRAKTLFATHYCELTELENQIPGAVNYNVAVHESAQGISFLHKILPGCTNKSYGIQVAKLAGIPVDVLRRAECMLQKLEKGEGIENLPKKKEKQPSLFPSPSKFDRIEDEMRRIDPNHLTPLEALKKIIEWKEKIV